MTRPDWIGCSLSVLAIVAYVWLLIRVTLFGWQRLPAAFPTVG
jgi:hypothetical protein